MKRSLVHFHANNVSQQGQKIFEGKTELTYSITSPPPQKKKKKKVLFLTLPFVSVSLCAPGMRFLLCGSQKFVAGKFSRVLEHGGASVNCLCTEGLVKRRPRKPFHFGENLTAVIVSAPAIHKGVG